MTTRRMVVLGGLGAAGALVVGYAIWPSTRIARANAMDAKPGERFLSSWIKVGQDDTVTVVIPHCDMGTGIYTSLSQMAAEELDADWSKLRAESAPSDPLFAYRLPEADRWQAELEQAGADVLLVGPRRGKLGLLVRNRANRRWLFTECRSGLVARRQVVEQALALFGLYYSAPSGHLRHFAIPLRAGEALLAHHVIVVAAEAGGFVTVGFGLSLRFGRGGSWGRSCL